MEKGAAEIVRPREDLVVWECFSPAEKAQANSCAILCESGFLFIDPVRLSDEAFDELSLVAPPWAVALTGGGVRRAADFFMERHGLKLLDAEAPEIVRAGFQIVPMDGATAGEVAFHHPQRGLLVVGEAISNTGHALVPLPKRLRTNPREFARSMSRLESLPFEICCFAHGAPVVSGVGKMSLASLLH